MQIETIDGASKTSSRLRTWCAAAGGRRSAAGSPEAFPRRRSRRPVRRDVGTYGPPGGGPSRRKASMASRIASASRRRTGCAQKRRLSGSTAGRLRPRSPVGSRRSRIRGAATCLQPPRTSSPARYSSNSGMRGRGAGEPKFSGVATSPTPKWCCQIRLTCTRASKAAGREPGRVSQRAKASRRPVVRARSPGGCAANGLSGSERTAGGAGVRPARRRRCRWPRSSRSTRRRQSVRSATQAILPGRLCRELRASRERRRCSCLARLRSFAEAGELVLGRLVAGPPASITHVIDDEAAPAAVLEPEAAVGQALCGQRQRLLLGDPIDEVLERNCPSRGS